MERLVYYRALRFDNMWVGQDFQDYYVVWYGPT